MLPPFYSMLHNKLTNRYHPILFTGSPRPSDTEGECNRYRSRGHHTEGFDTLDEADEFAKTDAERLGGFYDGVIFEWDGEGIPARQIG